MNNEPLGGSADQRPAADRNSILFVEDYEPDFLLAGRELRKLKVIHPIRCVSSTEQLLNYLGGRGEFADRAKYPFPAVIVMDIVLPDGSGVNAQAILAASVEYRDIPVVIISTNERVTSLRSAVTLGATGFMVKPFSGNEFVRILHEQGIALEFSAEI